MAGQAGLSSLASKFRGCMIGGLIGDCIGAPFEFDVSVSKSVLKKYLMNLLSDSPKQGTMQMFPYTDDTAMVMSVAKSLIEKRGFDSNDMAKNVQLPHICAAHHDYEFFANVTSKDYTFVDEYFLQPKRGYGVHVVDVFRALRNTDFQDVYEPAKHQFGGSGSYGNGAAMRVAPIALFGYKDEDLVRNMAEKASLITHTHQNGYNGAILQSLAVHQALKADASSSIDPVQYVDDLLKKMKGTEKKIDSVRSLEDMKSFCENLNIIKKIFVKKQFDMSAEEIAVLLGNDIAAHKSVPTAIFSFLRGFHPLENFKSDNSFERTLYFSIAVGGDTDTIACMAGSIAGAYHGESAIPVNLMKRCEAIEEIKNLSDQLFEICHK